MEPMTTMTGRVGQTPELRSTRQGVEFARFRVAHTPRLLRDGHWGDGETSWVTVLCYRGLAENVCRSLRRGDPVVVAGRARVETWVDEATKTVRESLTIDARAVGHDLSLGSSHFTRIKRERPDDADVESAAGGSEGAEGEGVEAGADTARGEDDLVPTPF